MPASLPTRPKRSRSTSTVQRDVRACGRWWLDEASFSSDGADFGRCLKVVFPVADPLDHVSWARPGLVVFAVLMPLVFILRIDAARDSVANYFQTSKSQAAQLIAKGRNAEALEPLRQAMVKHPNDVALIRQMSRAAAAVSPAEARRAYNLLEKMGATTDEDRASHSILLARLQDITGARAVLSKVSPSKRLTDLTQQAWLEVWKASGDFASAADVLTQLIEANSQLSLASSLAVVEAAEKSTVPLATLEKVEKAVVKNITLCLKSDREDEVKIAAPRLASIPWRSALARAEVSKALRSLPGNLAEFRMAAVRLGFPIALETNDRAALRQAWLDEITNAGGLSASDKDHVAAYLQNQKEHELVVDLIPEPEAATEYTLFLRRMDSLLELGRWRDVGVMSARQDSPALLQSRLLSQSLAQLCTENPQGLQAEHLLMTGLYEGRDERRPSACYAVGCAALEHRLPNVACQAFATALDLSKDRHTILESIINTSRHGGLNVAQLLNSFDGTDAIRDDSVQNQLVYLNLLAGHDVDTMREVIRNRRALAPDDVYLRFLDAFALHLRGAYNEAAELLVPLPRYRWHQGEAAVIASIVSAAGKIERSAPLLAKISASDLFAEERAMVEPWQHHLVTSGSTLVSKAESVVK